MFWGHSIDALLFYEGEHDAEKGFVQMEVEVKGEIYCWEEINAWLLGPSASWVDAGNNDFSAVVTARWERDGFLYV